MGAGTAVSGREDQPSAAGVAELGGTEGVLGPLWGSAMRDMRRPSWSANRCPPVYPYSAPPECLALADGSGLVAGASWRSSLGHASLFSTSTTSPASLRPLHSGCEHWRRPHLLAWLSPRGTAMRETRRITRIKVGQRHRKAMGDIRSLADSIEAVGLLHPVVIDSRGRLIAGQRRLEAVKLLGWKTVPVRVVDLEAAVEGEFDENAARKDFTPSEIASLARALRSMVEARARQRQVGKLRQGEEAPDGENFADGERGRAVDLIGRLCGVSGRTLEKIEAVVAAGEEDPEKFGHLVEEMDVEPRAVHRCHGKLQAMRAEQGQQPTRPAQERRTRLSAQRPT